MRVHRGSGGASRLEGTSKAVSFAPESVEAESIGGPASLDGVDGSPAAHASTLLHAKKSDARQKTSEAAMPDLRCPRRLGRSSRRSLLVQPSSTARTVCSSECLGEYPSSSRARLSSTMQT